MIKSSASNMLSFLTGGDDFDPDRIAADREQLRSYYRAKGFADAAVTTADARYDPAIHGFVLTFSIDEGLPYRFGEIEFACHVPELDCESLRPRLLARSGAVFDGSALDKSTELLAAKLAKLGFSVRAGRAPAARAMPPASAPTSPSPSIRGSAPMLSASNSTATAAPAIT